MAFPKDGKMLGASKARLEAMHDEVGVLSISLNSGGVRFMEIVEFDKRGL